MYIAQNGQVNCHKDDKFWLNYYSWKESQYGNIGPTEVEWRDILAK
jgi:hypothetical protein